MTVVRKGRELCLPYSRSLRVCLITEGCDFAGHSLSSRLLFPLPSMLQHCDLLYACPVDGMSSTHYLYYMQDAPCCS